MNFFQKSLTSRVESCLVLYKDSYSLDNQKILKLLKYDLLETSRIILTFIQDPNQLAKHSSYLTVWKLLVENSLNPQLISIITPDILPQVISGGSGRIFLLFLVDITTLYGPEHESLQLTTTTLMDSLPPEPEPRHTPKMIPVNDVPPEITPDGITAHFNKVNQTTEMFIEVLNFNQGNLGDNQLARELHGQLKDLKRINDHWLAVIDPAMDTSLLLACSEKLLDSFKLLEEMVKQDKLTEAERNLEKAKRDYELALERSKMDQGQNQGSNQTPIHEQTNVASSSAQAMASSQEDLIEFEDRKGKGKA